MDITVYGGGIQHIFANDLVSPVRPVVGLENDLCVAAEKRVRLHDVVAPGSRVSYFRTAQRVNVMHCRRAVFSHPERFVVGKIGIHLRRRLRAGRKLKYHPDPVYRNFLRFFRNLIGGRVVRRGSRADGKADSHRKTAVFPLGNERAVLVV